MRNVMIKMLQCFRRIYALNQFNARVFEQSAFADLTGTARCARRPSHGTHGRKTDDIADRKGRQA
jgi:hypothetical protein